jgi:hypothetical protein
MGIAILFISILSILVDIFLISGITDAYHIHTGIIAVIILLIYRHENAALYVALLYGLILDIIIINVPFGVFLVIHILMWAIFRPFIYNLISSKGRSILLIAFISSIFYVLIFNLSIWVSGYFFLDIDIFIKDLISFKKLLVSGIFNVIMMFLILHFSKIFAEFIKKWIFVKTANRL